MVSRRSATPRCSKAFLIVWLPIDPTPNLMNPDSLEHNGDLINGRFSRAFWGLSLSFNMRQRAHHWPPHLVTSEGPVANGEAVQTNIYRFGGDVDGLVSAVYVRAHSGVHATSGSGRSSEYVFSGCCSDRGYSRRAHHPSIRPRTLSILQRRRHRDRCA
ncbi:hypothetical protein BDV98DRAFT_573484 [Pterulicium gracile]|uniref:Uncharacterized protein n=1 Tax=Pterulicium gracile TaxID=1884261 RepID=A0A5C3Q8K5_9AGAR|nr:hypothetical protein BDV98DRAFT_573484 [Pterula gracilis]